MKRPFGMIVRKAVLVEPQPGVTLLTGPTTGGLPAPPAKVALMRMGVSALPGDVVGVAHVRHRDSHGELALSIGGIAGQAQFLVGAFVHEQGTPVLHVPWVAMEDLGHHAEAARFELESGEARGIVSTHGHLIDVWVLGYGGDKHDFLRSVTTITTSTGWRLNRESLLPASGNEPEQRAAPPWPAFSGVEAPLP